MSGLVAATFMGAASALGNLSLEAILKHSVDGSQGVEQSIWLQNLVLYCYTASLTLMLWVIDVSMEHAHKNLFYGWDGKTWILLLFQVSIPSITWTLYTWEKADAATFSSAVLLLRVLSWGRNIYVLSPRKPYRIRILTLTATTSTVLAKGGAILSRFGDVGMERRWKKPPHRRFRCLSPMLALTRTPSMRAKCFRIANTEDTLESQPCPYPNPNPNPNPQI